MPSTKIKIISLIIFFTVFSVLIYKMYNSIREANVYKEIGKEIKNIMNDRNHPNHNFFNVMFQGCKSGSMTDPEILVSNIQMLDNGIAKVSLQCIIKNNMPDSIANNIQNFKQKTSDTNLSVIDPKNVSSGFPVFSSNSFDTVCYIFQLWARDNNNKWKFQENICFNNSKNQNGYTVVSVYNHSASKAITGKNITNPEIKKFITLRNKFEHLKKISSEKTPALNSIIKWKIWFNKGDTFISIAEFDGKVYTLEHYNSNGYSGIVEDSNKNSETFAIIPVIMEKRQITDTLKISKLIRKIRTFFTKEREKISDRKYNTGEIVDAGYTQYEFIMELYSDDNQVFRFYKKFENSIPGDRRDIYDFFDAGIPDYKNKEIISKK